MTLVDCPLCDAPVPHEPAAGAFQCPECEVALAITEPERVLAQAA